MKPYWTFGGSRRSAISLDEFLAQKKAAGAEFFDGKEPWLKGVEKLSWQNFSGYAPKKWTTCLWRQQNS
jgi:hypothetical protein